MENHTILTTERLILRAWTQDDAQSLYEYASDPAVGPSAGWPPHKSFAESREIIRDVLGGPEGYAICLRENNKAIGAIALSSGEQTALTDRPDECELGYWIGRPFWGRGYVPEAAAALIQHGFRDLNMTTVWCAYYDGNDQSRRVQEKLGFLYHHTNDAAWVPAMQETRVEHVGRITREQYDAGHPQNKTSGSYDPARQTPILRCSICTGEQVAGFRDNTTGHIEEIALIRTSADLETFRKTYGITGDMEKVY